MKSRAQRVHGALHEAKELLPGQKPIESFVHHNTLHTFEDRPFLDAVVDAGAFYGASAWMDEESFRFAWQSGRILDRDLDDVLFRRFGASRAPAPMSGRRLEDAVRDLMLYQAPTPPSERIPWLLAEGPALRELPPHVSRRSRERLLRGGTPSAVLKDLWRMSGGLDAPPKRAPSSVRLRDRLVGAGHTDPDRLANPFLVRWFGAYLDQGMAASQLDRSGGLLSSLLQAWASGGVGWKHAVAVDARGLLEAGMPPVSVVLRSLDRLGVADEDVEDYVLQSLLALRGWAGMFVQMAARPDLLGHAPPPTPLEDVLALRLVVDEAAARSSLPTLDPATPLLRQVSGVAGDEAEARHAATHWAHFQACVALGVLPRELEALSRAEHRSFAAFLNEWSPLQRGELWQLAYERRYRVEILDALLVHEEPEAPPPHTQLVCCIDDREESFRRALEEVSPGVQTFGYAGFYGLAMYFRPLGESHARPLCPPSIVPTRVVVEQPVDPQDTWRGLSARNRVFGSIVRNMSIASHTALRGGLSSVVGWGTAVPFVAQTLAPRLYERLSTRAARPTTRLTLLADGSLDETTGLPLGFTLEQAADAVESALRTMGMTQFAPLVVVLGHGSRSMNNPHEAAHDCGACGGGRGGPNGRAFAWFANDPVVRQMLGERGLEIPDTTWFLGGYHNTCDDAVDVYDLDAVPSSHGARVDRLLADLDSARALDALERCRRFANAPLDLSPAGALAHVEERAGDLSQPRPEYGHATNALCLVGRRSWSRGLFLDRRVFLTSYDPGMDASGELLGALLASVGPVGAGINLEYYFSFVDRSTYGCDTKLPHNVAGLVGVMDGHSSDLRTGLPWQMVEIHEPVRLLVVIEGRPERLDDIVGKRPALVSLIEKRWILVAALDPESNEAWFLEPEGWTQHRIEDPYLGEAPTSVDWFRGRRDHLRPGSIRGARPGAGAA